MWFEHIDLATKDQVNFQSLSHVLLAEIVLRSWSILAHFEVLV